MRRVLIVAYFFPPLGGGGIQRTLKYARYLPVSGWQPVVITARNPGYEIRDPALEGEVPARLEVHRSTIWEPSRLYRWLVSVTGYAKRAAYREASKVQPAGPSSVPGEGQSSLPPRLGIWANLSRYLIFPDDQISWVPFAIRSAEHVLRDTPCDVLYSTSPPITGHVIAGLLKRRSGLPWVADFRDPWIGNAFAFPLPGLHQRFQRWIERWIIRNADRSVFATPSLTAMYGKRYPSHAHRFVTVPNGYDRSDYPVRRHLPPDGPFRLVYAGSLYGDQELAIFLGGLRRLRARRPELAARLKIEFVGWLSGRNRALADQIEQDDDLRDVVTFAGFLPRSDALDRLAGASAALHLLAEGAGKDLFVAGKLFDYLALDLPLLAVVPPGDVRTILGELEWGIIADPTDEAVESGLEQLMTAGDGRSRADPTGLYDRMNLARRLAGILDDVAGPE